MKMPRVIYNDDTCSLRQVDPPHDVAVVARAVDYLAENRVDRLCWNMYCGGLAYSYRSSVIENLFDFAARDPGRTLLSERNAMYALDARGVDYVPALIGEARRRGLEFYASLRMNDCHLKSQDALVPRLWREHPEYRLWGVPDTLSWHNAALDYSFPEVREPPFLAAEEIAGRYDIDGLELNFMRDPYCFQPEEAWAKRGIMTEFLERLREMLDRAGRRRGRRPGLMVSVPYDESVRRRAGLDLAEWVERRLVDLVAGCGAANDPDEDLSADIALCRHSGIPYFGHVEAFHIRNWRPDAALTRDQIAPRHNYNYLSTAEETCRIVHGMAHCALAQGADGVYLFNYPCRLFEPWWSPCPDGEADADVRRLKSALSACGDLEALARSRRLYLFWGKLPVYAEALRPARYFQEAPFAIRGGVGGDVFDVAFRCYHAPNPHELVPPSGASLARLLECRLNGTLIPRELLRIERAPAGGIPSGYTIPEHERWFFTVSGGWMRDGKNTLSFFMPDSPRADTGYVYIHDLWIWRRPA